MEIKKELDAYWDEALKTLLEDWTCGKCSITLLILKQTLLPMLKKYKCCIINIWGGCNVTTLALVISSQQGFHAAYSHCFIVHREVLVGCRCHFYFV